MFCAKCGSPLNAADRFCPKCGRENSAKKTASAKPVVPSPTQQQTAGTDTANATPQPVPAVTAPQVTPQSSESHFWRNCLFVVLGIILAIIIGIFILLWQLKNMVLNNIPLADLQTYLADDQLTEDEIRDIVIKFTENMDIAIDESLINEIVAGIETDLTDEDLKELKEALRTMQSGD